MHTPPESAPHNFHQDLAPCNFTKAGNELATRLAKAWKPGELDPFNESWIRHLSARITRCAPRYKRMQERACSIAMTDFQQNKHDRNEQTLETTISALVHSLPHPNNKEWDVIFQGDPRGATIKIKDDNYKYIYDDFGGEGVCVPNS